MVAAPPARYRAVLDRAILAIILASGLIVVELGDLLPLDLGLLLRSQKRRRAAAIDSRSTIPGVVSLPPPKLRERQRALALRARRVVHTARQTRTTDLVSDG